MDIYLAGGGAGNVSFVWRKNMDIYLAGTYSRPYLKENMGIFICAPHSNWMKDGLEKNDTQSISILESFVYVSDWMLPYIENGHWNFLLDSGAFTFMSDNTNSTGVNWDSYVARYCDFIRANKIEKFFELDIDVVVGLKEVERLRRKIEATTGAQPIPVWHKSRGMDYWRGMTKDYKYVAIGGIVTKEIKRDEHRIFTNLINIAKENGARVHGLGYTNLKGLEKYKFDSVDSTTWLYGNRSGVVYKFNGRSIIKINKPAGTMLAAREVAINNFREWVKFQKYAEKNL